MTLLAQICFGQPTSPVTDTYQYDSNGNVIADSHNDIAFIQYDIDNRPITVYKTNGTKIEYAYDASGERVRKYDGGQNTYYVHGADGRTEAVVTDDPSKTVFHIDDLGRAEWLGSNWSRAYYLKDHLGSICMTLSDAGNVLGYDDYYPLGMIMPYRSGNYGNAAGRYKFTGKERDVETQYDYFGARYYDARIGRWLQVDPLAEKFSDISPYVYTHSNPINRFDPDGRADWKLIRRGLLQAGLGYGTAIAGGYVAAQSGGTLLPILGTVSLMGGLTSGTIGTTNIIAGILEKGPVIEGGLIRTVLAEMGASRELQGIIGTSIATTNFVIDVITPQTSAPKLIEYLNKISTLKDLSEETREYAKTVLEQMKKREAEEAKKREEEKRKQEEERKKKEHGE